jgi:hypothetical protein
MTVIPCTICNGRYWWGAGALANSLYSKGFRGDIWIGYTGELPEWLLRSGPSTGGRYLISDGLHIVVHELSNLCHVAHQKPNLMISILDSVPEATAVAFFDADMVAVAPFDFFESWIENSIGLVLDHGGAPYLHEEHPWRKVWASMITNEGWKVRKSSQYFQSAFCGVPREHRVFLERWAIIIARAHDKYPGWSQSLVIGDRSHPFHILDQDAMAAAVMATESPLVVMGVEALGNGRPSYLAQHIRVHFKPWDFRFVRRALAGWGPTDPYDTLFLRHCRGPINLLSSSELRRRELELKIGKLISRLYKI